MPPLPRRPAHLPPSRLAQRTAPAGRPGRVFAARKSEARDPARSPPPGRSRSPASRRRREPAPRDVHVTFTGVGRSVDSRQGSRSRPGPAARRSASGGPLRPGTRVDFRLHFDGGLMIRSSPGAATRRSRPGAGRIFGRPYEEEISDGRYSSAAVPCAGTRGPPRRNSGFLQRAPRRGGIRQAARDRRRSGIHARSRLLDHPGPQPGGRGGRSLGRLAHRRGAGGGPPPHDDPARVRHAHADGPAPGQDLVLHAAHGRGGGELRLPASRSSRAT